MVDALFMSAPRRGTADAAGGKGQRRIVEWIV